MQIFWMVIASVFLLLIIYGMVRARLATKKPMAIGDLSLKRLTGVFDPEKLYLVVLNSGARFDSVKFVGYTDAGASGGECSVASRRWLILEGLDGKRVFLNAYRILWVREV
jgi:hypothetical protein